MEERMVVEEATARSALKKSLFTSSVQRRLATRPAFDQFMSLNSQIIHLSRRNSNVRSLALSLEEKPHPYPPPARTAFARSRMEFGKAWVLAPLI